MSYPRSLFGVTNFKGANKPRKVPLNDNETLSMTTESVTIINRQTRKKTSIPLFSSQQHKMISGCVDWDTVTYDENKKELRGTFSGLKHDSKSNRFTQYESEFVLHLDTHKLEEKVISFEKKAEKKKDGKIETPLTVDTSPGMRKK